MKKFTALFLVFSVLALSWNLYAKERKGADLIIQKTDGTQLRGELIAVKENSLLLLERESGSDVSVDINDIRLIRIKRKSKIMKGFLTGSLVFGGLGLFTTVYGLPGRDTANEKVVIIALFVATGGLLGALLGLASSLGDKIIQIEGKSDAEIQEILEKLRKKARIRNYQ